MLEVPPGQYRLHLGELDPMAGHGDACEAILTWTAQGPATEELDL